MHNHHIYMQRCLQLAQIGQQWVSPNPMVGAVLVHNGIIIGEGYHEYFGGAHAEVNAINSVQAQRLLKEATLYVSLEPCSHFGKTPPCVQLILTHQIPHVVVAMEDPNPLVAGSGIRLLRESGVKVETGILKEEALELNKRFVCYHTLKRPYITLKWAQTKDGFCGRLVDSKLSRKITNWYSDILVHQLRSTEMAILVGYNTALTDNPQLSNRNWYGKNPLRILLDPQGNLPENLTMFTDQMPILVFSYNPNVSNDSISYIKLENQEKMLDELLQHLYEKKIASVLIEGGPKTLQHFIDNDLWDEAHVFTSDVSWITGIKAPTIKKGNCVYTNQFINDQYRIIKPKTAI